MLHFFRNVKRKATANKVIHDRKCQVQVCSTHLLHTLLDLVPLTIRKYVEDLQLSIEIFKQSNHLKAKVHLIQL